MQKSFSVYGDGSNGTICLSGDIEETYWSGSLEDGEEPSIRDVVIVSDGTVLELYHDEGDPFCRIRPLIIGPAFQEVQRGEGESDEAFLEGEVRWVLVGVKTELLQFDGS